MYTGPASTAQRRPWLRKRRRRHFKSHDAEIWRMWDLAPSERQPFRPKKGPVYLPYSWPIEGNSG